MEERSVYKKNPKDKKPHIYWQVGSLATAVGAADFRTKKTQKNQNNFREQLGH